MNWIHKVRLRVLAIVLGMTLAAMAAVSWAAWPVLPVVGVAVAAAAMAVNKVSSRLSHPTCWACGADLRGQPSGEYGVGCPSCGAISRPVVERRA